MLRLGFENLVLIDGDIIEASNLNRQNYTMHDLGKPKVMILKKRLISVNPGANIEYINRFLDSEEMISGILREGDIAINAIDFSSQVPFRFDAMCRSLRIPVIHPYNLGWAGCCFVVTPDSEGLKYIQDGPANYEIQFVKYVISVLKLHNYDPGWLENCLTLFTEEQIFVPPPQLSAGSWLTAGLCTSVAYRLSVGETTIKLFPDFYFLPAI
jgi:molybdopterin/thiamine biosynthesis adenylyltransferase